MLAAMAERDFELGGEAHKRVAQAYLPDRSNYYYARCKLATDPLYRGVGQALAGSDAPLLDLGCGIGLLAQTLATGGVALPYTGFDNDADKIRQAEAAASWSGLTDTRFRCLDLGGADVIRDSGHCGSIAILDLLQFVPQQAQTPILQQAADAISETGRLVIRTGLADGNWRSSVTRGVDKLSLRLGWMNTGPKRYPDKNALQALLADAGLVSTCTPLWGKSPFNNWLVVAWRPAPQNGQGQEAPG